jgi:predicted nucleotidyltransferase
VKPTPYPDLNDVLDELVSGVREALGHGLLGAYLQGSFAAGGFDRHSDVDFVVVTRGELDGGVVDTLQQMHGRVFELQCEWAKHLEGSYFPAEVMRSCDRRGEDLWYLEHGARSLTRSEHCNTAVVRWVVREHGVALAGPDPAKLVDVVPTELLRDEIRDTAVDWGREVLTESERFRNRFYQSFIVLSYCRMLRDIEVGQVGSKRDGAEWAKANLDESWAGLIDRSWDGRLNPSASIREPADPNDFEATLDLVRLAISLIEKQRGAAGKRGKGRIVKTKGAGRW